MIVRELRQSALNNYINGNYSDLTEEEKILSAKETNTLGIDIINDICSKCGDCTDYCNCEV